MPLAQESFRAPVDVVTLVFAAASGRVIEMSTVSVGFGVDGAAVVSLQLVRVLLAVAIAGIATSRLEVPAVSQAGADAWRSCPSSS